MESLTGQETKPCRKGRRNSQKICSKVAVDVDSHRGVSSKIVTLSRRIKDLSPLIPILLQYYYSGIGIEGVGERGQGERDRPVMEGIRVRKASIKFMHKNEIPGKHYWSLPPAGNEANYLLAWPGISEGCTLMGGSDKRSCWKTQNPPGSWSINLCCSSMLCYKADTAHIKSDSTLFFTLLDWERTE